MKNLKKVLALVLALVMVFGAVVTSNAAFKDAEKITADYSKAVDALSALKVLEGFPVGDNYEFRPQDSLTRAQAAKVIAIFDNASTDIKELYAARCEFTDVAANHWARSYIGYCAHEGLLTGIGNGKYDPEGALTGVAFLKMVLNVLGYDTEKEGYTGAKWAVNVLAQAKSIKLTANMAKGWNAENVITREEMAQVMFNALDCYTVEYGYANKTGKDSAYVTVAGAVNTNKTLAEATWGLKKANVSDIWGRPGYQYENSKGKAILGPFMATPDLKAYASVKGCDVVTAGVKAGTKLTVYTNGMDNKSELTVKDSSAAIAGSAQGRLVEVYADYDVVVYIDTYLARVESVTKKLTDEAGHTAVAASVKTTVFDGTNRFGTNTVTGKAFATDKFQRGDYVLVTICDNKAKGYEGKIASMELATSKNAKVTALNTVYGPVDAITKVAALDGETATVNNTAYYVDGRIMLTETYLFYFDAQGNIIGKTDATAEFTVLDAIYKNGTDGVFTVKASAVNPTDAAKSTVTVDMIRNNTASKIWSLSVDPSNNVYGYYYKLWLYSVDKDGNYNLDVPNTVYYSAYLNEDHPDVSVKYVKGAKYFTVTENSETHHYEVNAETQFLFQSSESPNGTFEAFKGYDTPSLSGTIADIVVGEDGFVDLVYIYGAKTATKTVFVPDITAGQTIALRDGKVEYTLNVLVVETAEDGTKSLKPDTIKYLGTSYDRLANAQAVGFKHAGLYDISLNGDYFVDSATERPMYMALSEVGRTYRFRFTSIDHDDNNDIVVSLIEESPLYTVWEGNYDVQDCSQKNTNCVGGSTKVSRQYNKNMEDIKTGDLFYIDFTDANRNGKLDEGEKVNAVYDMNYLVKVIADKQVTLQSNMPKLYLGKAFVNFEATADKFYKIEDADVYCVGSSDNYNNGYTAVAKDADAEHNVARTYTITGTNMMVEGDIRVEATADPAHSDGRFGIDNKANKDNFEVALDAASGVKTMEELSSANVQGTITITIPADATVKLNDLFNVLTVPAHVASIAVYDNTLANVNPADYDNVTVATDNNLFVVVTAEDGTLYRYNIVVAAATTQP